MKLKTDYRLLTTLLYIEPKSLATAEPLIDMYTRKMTAALRRPVDMGALSVHSAGSEHEDVLFHPGMVMRGFHCCKCGKASSGNCDYVLADGSITNSLAIHYLAYHRQEVPARALEIIAGFKSGEEEPTEDDLSGAVWRYHEKKKLFISKAH